MASKGAYHAPRLNGTPWQRATNENTKGLLQPVRPERRRSLEMITGGPPSSQSCWSFVIVASS